MLDREAVKDFLEEEFKEGNTKTPKGISKEALVEAFCRYSEDDYYEWLKDNLKTFFNHGTPDWDWISERIKAINMHS